MADLTRFDFNAHNFLQSETVEVMTDAEIGQYIMLLAKAWTLAKAASLPDDLDLLAKWSHCRKVSDKVLFKFPVVDTEFGPRRRNEVLYKEWLKALDRTNIAVESGRVGAATRWAAHRDPIGLEIAQTKPSQAVPNQSNQSNGASDFKNLAIRYRRAFATRLSGSKNVRQRYAEACRTYGESIVLEMFDNWSATAGWIKDWAAEGKLRTDGLKGFYESLPEQIEIETAAKSEQVATQSAESDRETQINNMLEKSHAEFLEKRKLQQEEFDEEDAAALRIQHDPGGFFGQTK